MQSVLNDVMQQGLIQSLILVNCSNDFLVTEYVDDTLMAMSTDLVQLLHLTNIVDEFTISSGLKVNFHKSKLYHINV